MDLLARGWSIEELLANYPGIEEADIRACIAYGAEMSLERHVDIPRVSSGTAGRADGAADADEHVRAPRHKEWHSRGYIPHFDHADLVQMITFRLADALPQHLLDLGQGGWCQEA